MLLSVLYFLPKKLCSYIFGALVRIRFPDLVARFLNGFFVKLFRIDLSDALDRDFACIEDLFTRRLKEGARVMESSFVSPCDGRLVYSQPCLQHMAVQVKGMTYSLKELVFGRSSASFTSFNPAWFTTIYLAPYNYHRVHSPLEARLVRIRYIRGTLWPVNDKAVESIPFLFNLNERMVFELQAASGGTVHLVMVGAFNVGRIATPFWPDFVANSAGSISPFASATIEKECNVPVGLGQELGTFMLGSTVVLVLDASLPTVAMMQELAAQVVTLGKNLLKD